LKYRGNEREALAGDGVPKVLANKLIVTSDNEWLLPFWREPVDSW